MHAAFKASISGSKHERRDSLLKRCQQMIDRVQSFSYVVCGHQKLLKMIVSLTYPLAVVYVESSKCVNLLVQMLGQRIGKAFDEISDTLTIIVCGKTGPSVLLELIESRRECSVLLYIAFHQPRVFGYTLNIWKEVLFFGIVVVVHGFRPALTIDQKVSGRVIVAVWDVRRLEVDRVQPAYNPIVSESHLRCNVVRCMGGLRGDV